MTDFVAQEGTVTLDSEPTLDTWGTKGYLMAEQHEALLEFIETADVEQITAAKFRSESLENVALRFLRARQFSLPASLELLAKCVEKKESCRAKYFAQLKEDECVQCDNEALKNYYPHSMLGFDKLNRPILFEQSGKVNPAAITSMTTYSNLIDYHWLTMEKHLNEMFDTSFRTNGTAIISTCAILDLEGLGLVHCTGAALEHVQALIALDNVCYPETLGKMFVINSPWLAGDYKHTLFICYFILIIFYFYFLFCLWWCVLYSDYLGSNSKLAGPAHSS